MVAGGHVGQQQSKDDTASANGREQDVESTNRILLLLDVGRGRKTGRVEACPNANHRANEQSDEYEKNETNRVCRHRDSQPFVMGSNVMPIARPAV